MYEKLFDSIAIEIKEQNSDSIPDETKDTIINFIKDEIRIRIKESFEHTLKNEIIKAKNDEIKKLLQGKNPLIHMGDLDIFIDENDKIELSKINSTMLAENLYSELTKELFKDILIDARKLLKTLDINKYDINNVKDFSFYPSKALDKKSNSFKVSYANTSDHSFKKQVTERFNKFLKACDELECFHTEKRNNKYYISLYDCISFCLHYMFFEGKAPDTRYTKSNSYSFNAYQITLSHTIDFFQDKSFANPRYIDRVFEIAQLHRIDNEFMFFRINRLIYQRNMFFSDENLFRIYSFIESDNPEPEKLQKSRTLEDYEKHLSVMKSRIKETKEIIDKEIFHDTDFIKFCLSTTHPDPIYVLSIYIKAYINHYNYCKDNLLMYTKSSLDRLIADCKKQTQDYLDSLSKVVSDKVHENISNIDFSEYDLAKEIPIDLISTIDIDVLFSKFMKQPGKESENQHLSYWQEYYFKNREPLNKLRIINEYSAIDPYMEFIREIIDPILPKILKIE